MATIWKPQPKQAQFLKRPEYEALYGGAAGDGGERRQWRMKRPGGRLAKGSNANGSEAERPFCNLDRLSEASVPVDRFVFRTPQERRPYDDTKL